MLIPSMIQLLEVLMSKDTQQGEYSIVYINKAKKTPPRKLVFGTKEKILEYVREEMKIEEGLNYYVTINPSEEGSWRNDSICAVKTFVIDLDRHDVPMADEKIDNVKRNICSLWQGENVTILAPNFIVKTGRGLQLWWIFSPNPNQDLYVKMLTDVKQVYIKKIGEVLHEIGDPLELDGGASNKLQGFFRLPGTYNTASNTLVTCDCIYNGHYDLEQEYNNCLAADLIVESPKHKKNANTDSNPIEATPECEKKVSNGSLHAFAESRMDSIRRIRAHLDRPAGNELRDIFCHIFYCGAHAVYSHKEAMKLVKEFNAGFKNPLTDKELESYLSTSNYRRYKYSDSTICEKVGITKEEFDLINGEREKKKRGNGHEKRDARAKEAREENEEEMWIAYIKYGTYVGAAKATGFDRRTIRRVVLARKNHNS